MIGICIRTLCFLKRIGHINDVSSHFKLARSVLMIASFEFANLQCFNSTFMKLKISWLVLNAKCEIVVFTQCSSKWLFCDSQNIVHRDRLYLYAYK